MRKSTLLLGLLVAASASAADYVVPELSTKDAPKYYKIVSNRALTLLYGQDPNNTEGKNAVVEAGQGTFGQRPYVGLFDLQKAAISNDPTYVPDASLLWSFQAAEGNTSGLLEDGAMWVNLYSPTAYLMAGSGSGDYAHLTTTPSVVYAFNLNYVNEAAVSNGTPEPFWNNSYCISREHTPSAACFDVKNYVGTNQKWADAPYAFMAAEWNPFSDFGVDPATGAYTGDYLGNPPTDNNGSVFYFEEATAEEIAKAKEELAALDLKTLQEKGPQMILDAQEAALAGMIAYENVPALWSASAVAAVVAQIEALELSMDGMKSVIELTTAISAYDAKVAELESGLVKSLNGKVVKFQNCMRGYLGDDATPAYLAAGIEYSYDEATGDEIQLPALVMVENGEDNEAAWTLLAVEGGVKLYNETMNAYPVYKNPAVNQSWTTVEEADSAAVMLLVGVPEEEVFDDNGNPVEITNVVGIKNVGAGASGYPFIHAAGSGTNYNVVGWTRDSYNSASNWIVTLIEDNGAAIESVEVEKAEKAANVIYDLAGRRVTNISRTGLYIVNGKKVIVKK